MGSNLYTEGEFGNNLKERSKIERSLVQAFLKIYHSPECRIRDAIEEITRAIGDSNYPNGEVDEEYLKSILNKDE